MQCIDVAYCYRHSIVCVPGGEGISSTIVKFSDSGMSQIYLVGGSSDVVVLLSVLQQLVCIVT